MADTRNRKEIVDISDWKPYDDPKYGSGAVREITYIDGTIERRWFAHGTGSDPGVTPESGYLVGTPMVDPKVRAEWDKNTPPAGTQRNPDQQRSDAAAATKSEQDAANATRIANESSWNADPANRANGGSGRYEDHATRDARLDKEKKDADTKARQTTIDQQNATTAAAASRRADSAESRAIAEANKVGSKVESVPRGGQDYTKITKTSPDGKTTAIEYYGPDGNQIAALPSEGAATTGGPKMPQIVVGASQDALRQYHEALWADPSLTPAQREKRFQEAVQTANIAVAESTAAETKRATLQREQESQRNTDYNVGVSSAKFLQDGQQAAFKFASELKGTDLGGKVFAAMLGLNLATLEASNLNRLTSQGKPLPTITPSDMRSTIAIDAKRAEIDQHLATVTPPNAIGLGAIGMPAAPAPATPSAPGPATAPRPATPGPVVGPQAAPSAPPAVGVNPDAGQALGPTGDSAPLPTAPAATPSALPPQPANPPQFQGYEHADTPPWLNQATGDAAIPPAWPPIVPPTQYGAGEGDTQSMTPPTDFAALSQFQAPPPMPMQQPAAGGGDMVALLRAQARATPSWHMDEETYRRMMAAGVPEEEFWASPVGAA